MTHAPRDTGKANTKALDGFYERIGEHNLAPLWEVIHKLVARTPITKAVPHLWPYAVLRPYLMESGGLITAKQAERRVLVLENPALRGLSKVVDTLYAGLQLILPGEVAPAHRHTPSALRFIIEGDRAFTAVNGEKTYMAPGDFVITPNWAWHDHGHEGDGPMVWLDGLDLPIVHFTTATFAENYGEDQYPTNAPPGYTRARYGNNMRPVTDKYDQLVSPIFSYPYERTREALALMEKTQDWDDVFGLKMEYLNPLNGGPAMPTMSTFMQLLPKGFKGKSYQTTEHAIYSVVEGHGRVEVGTGRGTQVLSWGPKDHFVIPGWCPHRFGADEEAVLFSFSDQVMQQKLELWREHRG